MTAVGVIDDLYPKWNHKLWSRPLSRTFDLLTTYGAVFWSDRTSFRHTFPFVALPFLRSGCRRGWSSQVVDQPQDLSRYITRHGDRHHREGDVQAVSDDTGPDLDQLLPDRRQRPLLHLFGQRQGLHEVGQVVGQGMKLEPNRVVLELAAWQPDSFTRANSFKTTPF